MGVGEGRACAKHAAPRTDSGYVHFCQPLVWLCVIDRWVSLRISCWLQFTGGLVNVFWCHGGVGGNVLQQGLMSALRVVAAADQLPGG
jgi:hypothetical protein